MECQIEKKFVALWHVEYAIHFSDSTYLPGWQWALGISCKWLRLFFFSFLLNSRLQERNEHNLFANVMKFQDKKTNQTSASLSLCYFQVKFLSCLSKHSHDCSTTSQLSIYKTKVNDFFLWILIYTIFLYLVLCIIIIINIYACKVYGYWLPEHEQAYGFLLLAY